MWLIGESLVPDFVDLGVLCLVGSFIAFVNVTLKCAFKAKHLLYFLSCFQSSHKYKLISQKRQFLDSCQQVLFKSIISFLQNIHLCLISLLPFPEMATAQHEMLPQDCGSFYLWKRCILLIFSVTHARGLVLSSKANHRTSGNCSNSHINRFVQK